MLEELQEMSLTDLMHKASRIFWDLLWKSWEMQDSKLKRSQQRIWNQHLKWLQTYSTFTTDVIPWLPNLPRSSSAMIFYSFIKSICFQSKKLGKFCKVIAWNKKIQTFLVCWHSEQQKLDNSTDIKTEIFFSGTSGQ